MHIFLSYRRLDVPYLVGRVHDSLHYTFPNAMIFQDIRSLEPGQPFLAQIRATVQLADVVLALIGHGWLGAGRVVTVPITRFVPRIQEAHDPVRLEIEAALDLGKWIIPVLVDGASLPDQRLLPKSLHPLLQRHVGVIRADPDFAHDFEVLVAVLRGGGIS